MLNEYRTIIGGHFQQPITNIVYELVRKDRVGTPTAVNSVDLDWTLSGVLLSVAMFESYLRWVRQNRADVGHELDGLEFYERLRSKHPQLPDIGEVFVVRNTIAHGHVWMVATELSKAGELTASHELGRRDKLFKRYLARDERSTTPNGLSLIPTLVSRRDLRKVLELIITAMQTLIDLDLLLPQSLNSHRIWPDRSGRRIRFDLLPKEIPVGDPTDV